MPGLFNTVITKIPRRNAFNLSHENHLSCQFGQLVPVLCEECIPGDKFRLKVESVVKLAPLLAPVMARIDVSFMYYFVPNRLLFSGWEDFITSGEDGESANGTLASPVAPYMTYQDLYDADLLAEGSLADFLGLPSQAPHTQGGYTFDNIPPINALPWLAYKKVFSDWFRDELLQPNDVFQIHAGGQLSATELADLNTLRYRSWKKDYFTSARPNTQLGSPVGVPISGDIVNDGAFRLGLNNSTQNVTNPVYRRGTQQEDLGSNFGDGRFTAPLHSASSTSAVSDATALYYTDGLSLDNAEMLINDLRRSLAAQRWKETNMRGGNRYIENIFNHFGVRSSDARLQRSQYLGGKKVPVVVGDVLQSIDTSNNNDFSTSKNPLGRRGGVAAAVGASQTVSKYCEEHGWLLCIMSITPRASYFQGIPRKLANRWDRFDYAWPEFGNLGEQDVFNYEIFLRTGANAANSGTFGYQSRYAEYKNSPSEIHGAFRSSLDYWHTGRKFANAPALNANFIKMGDDNTANDTNRIFAVKNNSSAEHFYVHLYHNVKVLRHLPKYGIPAL